MISARRTLAGKFVELRVSEGAPSIDGRPYEAAYFIGVSGTGRFVIHLLDVFGAAYSAVPGHGHRELDDVVFEFCVHQRSMDVALEHSDREWSMRQTYIEAGTGRLFATKRMERTA